MSSAHCPRRPTRPGARDLEVVRPGRRPQSQKTPAGADLPLDRHRSCTDGGPYQALALACHLAKRRRNRRRTAGLEGDEARGRGCRAALGHDSAGGKSSGPSRASAPITAARCSPVTPSWRQASSASTSGRSCARPASSRKGPRPPPSARGREGSLELIELHEEVTLDALLAQRRLHAPRSLRRRDAAAGVDRGDQEAPGTSGPGQSIPASAMRAQGR